MNETPTAYPIWSSDHEAYIQMFVKSGYPQDKVDQYRNELETLDVDRVEDFTNFLALGKDRFREGWNQ